MRAARRAPGRRRWSLTAAFLQEFVDLRFDAQHESLDPCGLLEESPAGLAVITHQTIACEPSHLMNSPLLLTDPIADLILKEPPDPSLLPGHAENRPPGLGEW